MSKGEDSKMLKLQTCVLKVNIHCDGCQKKVKKLVQKIEGVYAITVDPNQGKVTVSGTTDPATIIKKLNKAGKHVELWPTKGGGNSNISSENNNDNLLNQLQKLQLEQAKVLMQQQQQQLPMQDNGKLAKGGAGQQKQGNGKHAKDDAGDKNQKGQEQQEKQNKGFKDLKFPSLKDFKFPFKKNRKTVKFDLPSDDTSDEGSDYDHSDDNYNDGRDFDNDLGGFNDCYGDPKMMKPMIVPQNAVNNKGGAGGGGGGNGNKGVQVLQVQNKGAGGNVNKGAKKEVGVGNQKQAAAAGGGKNGGGNIGDKDGGNSGGKKGGGGGGKNDATGGGKPPVGQPNMMPKGFLGLDLGQMGGGNMPKAMGIMGNIPSAQVMPAGGAVPPGYFPVVGMVPPGADVNPYQQQLYINALLQQQQQQQQRMMMMNSNNCGGAPEFPSMMGHGYVCARPAAYMLPPQPHGESYSMFSDDNPNGCSVM